MTKTLRGSAVVVLAGLLLAGCAGPQAARATFENDLFGGSDRYFTNLVRFDVLLEPTRTPGWLGGKCLEQNKLYPLLDAAGDIDEYRLGLSLTQNMYTAEDISRAEPQPDDRPYAAWLRAGLQAERKFHVSSDDTWVTYDRLELIVGVIGPSALGEQTQDEVHRWRGIDRAQAWDTQLPDEATLDLDYERRWRRTLGGARITGQVIPRIGGTIGTTFDQLRVGAQFRYGLLPDDFGMWSVSLTRPTPADVPPVEDARTGWSLYGMLDIEGRAVARNAFLDGSLYHNSRSVDREPLVGELRYGAAVGTPWNFSFAYIFIHRTHEFESQRFDQSYGSVQVAFNF